MSRTPSALMAAALLLALAACGDGSAPAPPPVTANRVIDYAPLRPPDVTESDWPQFFHEDWALGPPGGTLDSVSLGYDKEAPGALGGSLTLGLGAADDAGTRVCVEDRPGDDFVVYENVFAVGGGGTYIEVATVSVSEDNAVWYTFAHRVLQEESSDPAGYSGFAGVTPTAQGGDRFDLEVLIAAESPPPEGWQACYVRLVDGGTLYPDYGNTQSDLWSTGADIDAVEVLHAVEAPGLSP